MSDSEKPRLPWYNDWRIWVFACLTLGLAPFFPEPHVWEKIKMIAEGGGAMKAIDWFDILLHGSPWIMLIRAIFLQLKPSAK